MSVQRGPDRMGRFTARVGRTGRAQLLLVALAASASIGVHGQPSAWRPVPLRPPDEPSLPLVCEPPDATGRIRTAAAAAAGTALSYWQDPPWLMARDDQGLRLRRFVVAGDVDRVRFDRWDVDTQDYVEETWTRDRSDTIGGRLVSIFEPSWPADVIQRRLELALVGLDRPSFWLGVYRGPVDGPAASSSVNVRVGSQAMGTTEVVRIDDTAQYASHVVNLVIPDFGDDRVGGAFDLRPVARAFYDYFADDYDVLAIVPYDGQIDSATAFHQRVRNDVSGIGLSIFDRSADYGSGGRLRGVELFHQTGFGWNDVSTHELTHAWGHDFDWTRIAGIARAGHQPTSHAPLMTGGETQLGAVLEPTRRAVIKDDDSAVIERVRGPARQHPLDLYAMGLADVPELGTFTLFEDQAQFDASSSSTPAPGTAVAGGRKTVSVNDLLGANGSRRGPVPSDITRATIVVSRGGLVPASELAMWNVLAARQEDAAGTGTLDYDGQGSFLASTYGRVNLRTGIQPRNAGALPRTQDPEPARAGASDCRAIEFTSAPPTRVRAGQRFTVAGRVRAQDRSDYSRILIRFWPSDGDKDKDELTYADISRTGQFTADVEIRAGREGQYEFDAYLFWPGAPSQYPRCRLSVTSVTP